MQLTLEELRETLKLGTPVQCEGWIENCMVALENSQHLPGCQLELKGDYPSTISLNWITKKISRSSYKEANKYIEKGAEALSFLLATALTDYEVIEEGLIGSGFDYWLAYKEENPNYDEFNFFNARLEISGIEIESLTNKVEYRATKKKKQTNVSDNLELPAYISIIEFASPKAHFSKK